jgi:transcriptional regulator with XRE-family HTH domain
VANERLRNAIAEAGIDTDELARRIEVDAKTVGRWLSGRTPHPRHRARVAQLLDRREHELWPETALPPVDDDARREIVGTYARADDVNGPEWRALLRQASDSIELLGLSLIDVLPAAGVTDALAAKAGSGCGVRILISAADSVWVTTAAQQLGQHDEDHIGNNALQREIELARGLPRAAPGTAGDRTAPTLRRALQLDLALRRPDDRLPQPLGRRARTCADAASAARLRRRTV